MDDILDRYRRLTACDVSDGMYALGMPNDGLAGIFSISRGVRVVGTAMTVRFEPVEDPTQENLDYLSYIQPGEILMLANAGRLDFSVWGDLRSAAAVRRGAVATVVDGAYRDVDEHIALGYPVFGRASTIVSSRGRATAVAMHEVVEMAGVRVTPGDVVLADSSGVVVVPRADAAPVAEAAEAVAAENVKGR